MTAVRLTLTYGRITGLPHRPETHRKGHRTSEDFPHWQPALDRLAQTLREAEAEGRPVNLVSLTPLTLARKNLAAAAGQEDS